MLSNSNHIISTFNWNTFLDQKERAFELQGRLSAWSGINMQKEINEVFNRLCPPDQTWRIDQLELDLGVIEMDSLESDLARQLRIQLTEKLTDLIIYADKAGQNNIEITNQYDAPIDMLRSYLLTGVMPWNYKASDGSLNQMLSWQFQHNRQTIVAMLKEIGVTQEDFRKRMAWQMNEANIQKTIEGFEPGNHEQINRFSNELIKIQAKENVVRAGTADFKKNVWLWILNYLLTERGTLFNKHSFLKSSIVQMSAHYNIGYEELLQLLNDAVEEVNKSTTVKADFLLALKALSKDNTVAEEKKNAREKEKRVRLLYYRKDVQQEVRQYTVLLQPLLKNWSPQKISSRLKDILRNTASDYAVHQGNVKVLKKMFATSIVFHLPINKAQFEACLAKPRKPLQQFDVPEPGGIVSTAPEKLLMVYRKGLMNELIRLLIIQQHIPFWFRTEGDDNDVDAAVQDIINYFPDSLLMTLKNEIASDTKNTFINKISKYKHLLPVPVRHFLEKLQLDISLKHDHTFIHKDIAAKIRQLMKPKEKVSKISTPVRNAGIVLLNSYIPMLLERLNIIINKKFETLQAQEQAVLYLQYVVTGMSHAEETELALNKVLCGLPLSQPVHNSIEISEENKNLIDGLIKAAIGYWPSIGDCSVDGFRGNWLVRDGLLTEQEDKWELVVKKRAYDVLINHSPFSFSIIKYLWMNKPLHVSWAY